MFSTYLFCYFFKMTQIEILRNVYHLQLWNNVYDNLWLVLPILYEL